ncbi:MAG: class F sortase [Candidatus Paceibacterota bacterium]
MALLTANTAESYQQEQVKSELPARLKIPSINVDAAIEYKSLTPEGAMDVPKGPDDIAWFDLGPRPGENGSAVIAGHRGWKNGRVAVFDNLDKLRKGDKIYVEDISGKSVSFVVRESRIYDSEAYVPEVFASNDGIHLNLVTCVGVWDKSKKSSSQRLVVFTDIIQ